MVTRRSTLEWMLPYRNLSAQWSLVVTLRLCSKPEAKKKFSDILTETHDGVFYQRLRKKPHWRLFLFRLWHFYQKKMLKSTSDNQSIPFPKETEWQHQNNNMITIRITICLNGERQNSFVMLRILPRMIFKYTL